LFRFTTLKLESAGKNWLAFYRRASFACFASRERSPAGFVLKRAQSAAEAGANANV
jgi:hypothetical protein